MQSDLYVFHHITQINHWEQILQEQLQLLMKSNLYDAARKIFYSHLGNDDLILPDKYERLVKANFSVYELPTIDAMQNIAKACQRPSYFLYFHLKGVSYPKGHKRHQLTNEWRNIMQKSVIENWRHCISYLVEGYDTVGVEWHGRSYNNITNSRPHWHGNFWWATSDYLKSLPSVYLCDGWGRYKNKAEVWIGYNRLVRPKSLKQFNCDFTQYFSDNSPI